MRSYRSCYYNYQSLGRGWYHPHDGVCLLLSADPESVRGDDDGLVSYISDGEGLVCPQFLPRNREVSLLIGNDPLFGTEHDRCAGYSISIGVHYPASDVIK